MSEDWKVGYNAAMLKFLQTNLGKSDAKNITSVETERQERGYCDTCGYTVTVVVFNYTDTNGKWKTTEWEGEFGDLIAAL